MDKERRSRLKSVVGQARRIVEDDVRTQLRRLGIDESGIKPVERLPHLSVEDKELRTKIIEAIEKEKAGDISYVEAFSRYVRHVGFTYMNRIAALRAMEVRNLIKETVIRRDVYGGRSGREYELAERERISDPYELLRAGLVEAFNDVSAEIKVLFDVNSEYSLVFLGHKALLELIRLLSEEIPEEDWKEDDVIGWIYQYYNEEARAEFKKSKRKPKADDIPVVNQFYTPRWVVRVLVDNTLGRLWLEMNGRCPKLGGPIKRTKEQLEHPSGDKVDDFCSYLVPLSQESAPRERKRVKEIKVLDPACGSGHFLVYAFDVLFKMYREDEPYTTVEDIPRLILENNLFGIDIDLRAVQLAALSLYLKAKSYNPKLKISKMNLVCADARITDGKVRKVFLDKFADDPELQKIFAKIFEDLEYTFDVGSLLKVRRPFERFLERRKQEKGAQAILFPQVEGQTAFSKTGRIEGQAKLAISLAEEKEGSEIIAIPKVVTLEQMLNALRKFEREAMEKRDMGTLLFATEAEKSVGLLALLTQKYDVVLMNPAYGDMPARTKEYVEKYFPRTKNDYYAAFIEQALDLTEPNGFSGMLTSRTFMFLRTFQRLREDVLWNEGIPELLLDTGFGVLDGATVETTAMILRKLRGLPKKFSPEEKECTFCRLSMFGTYDKEEVFMTSFLSYLQNNEHELWYRVKLGSLTQVPRTAYAYWASPTLMSFFIKYPPLDRDVASKPSTKKIADVKQGLATADDARFTRFWWEVNIKSIGKGKKWIPLALGTWLDRFYADIVTVVAWKNQGLEIKNYPKAVIRNESFYYREGIAWMTSPQMGTILKGTLRSINMRRLPPDCIFTTSVSAVLLPLKLLWAALGYLNSTLAYFLLRMQTTRGLTWGCVAALPFPSDENLSHLAVLAKEAHDLLYEWETGNETSTIFIKPWILQILRGFNSNERPLTGHPFASQFRWSDLDHQKKIRSMAEGKEAHLEALARLATEREDMVQQRLEELQRGIDDETYRLFKIEDRDKILIEKDLAFRRGEFSLLGSNEVQDSDHATPNNIDLDAESKINGQIIRLISFYIKTILESDSGGIVSLKQLVQEIRKYIADDFGEYQLDRREREIEENFGKSLEEWVTTEYFSFHVNLYKRRPIFWHLTSSNFSTARGSKGVINIFLHYHKLDRDTVPKILTNYLKPELEATKWKTERLKRELQEARNQSNKTKERELSKQLEESLATLEELQNFQKALETVHDPRLDKTELPKNPTWLQQKIAEVRDNGYNPVIDYGVRVNIEPLKEAGLLHKAAQRVK